MFLDIVPLAPVPRTWSLLLAFLCLLFVVTFIFSGRMAVGPRSIPSRFALMLFLGLFVWRSMLSAIGVIWLGLTGVPSAAIVAAFWLVALLATLLGTVAAARPCRIFVRTIIVFAAAVIDVVLVIFPRIISTIILSAVVSSLLTAPIAISAIVVSLIVTVVPVPWPTPPIWWTFTLIAVSSWAGCTGARLIAILVFDFMRRTAAGLIVGISFLLHRFFFNVKFLLFFLLVFFIFNRVWNKNKKNKLTLL